MDKYIKLYIDLPFALQRKAIIRDRDQVANLLIAAMKKYGYQVPENKPVRWGFGVVSKSLNSKPVSAKQFLHAVQRVIVGSSDPDIAAILAQLQPADLLEPNQVPGAGLDLRMATIYSAPPWQMTEAAAFYCVSPLCVTEIHLKTEVNPKQSNYPSYLETGDKLNELLNNTMQARFGRPFDLTFIPDSLYVRSIQGKIVANMAFKTLNNGQALTRKGLVLPFILTGASEDLRDVWYSGLGRSTARGFGCLELQQ